MPIRPEFRRVRSVSLKLTEEEYAALSRRAAEERFSVGEFARTAVCEALYDPAETRVLMAQVIRTEQILGRLLRDGFHLDPVLFGQIVADVDRQALGMADERLARWRQERTAVEVVREISGGDGNGDRG